MALAGPADRTIAGLVRLLPPELRERHGREIAQVFRAEWRLARSRTEKAWLWSATVVGLITTAIPEHAAILNHDLVHAARRLRNSPSFAVPSILILSFSIGAAVAALGLVNTITFRPWPFTAVERLLYVEEVSTAPNGDMQRFRMAGSCFRKLQAQPDLFESIVAHRRVTAMLEGPSGRLQVPRATVSEGWSALSIVLPARGRLFTPAEESAGLTSGVAIVSWQVWTDVLGAPASLDHAALRLDGRRHRVVGVMPDRFHFPYEAEVWTPGDFPAEASDLLVIARRHQDRTIESIDTALSATATEMRTQPDGLPPSIGLSARSLREGMVERGDRVAWLLFAAASALLLIASLNVAYLLSVRLAARRREFVIRSALGASPRRQARQCQVEILVLFSVSAALGILCAYWQSAALARLLPVLLRTQLTGDDVPFDLRLAAAAAVAALILGYALGTLVIRHALRAHVGRVLSEDGLATTPARRARLVSLLAGAQVALAVVLGSLAALLVSSVSQNHRLDLGFDPAPLVTFQLDFSSDRFAAAESRERIVEQVVGRLRLEPGVEEVAVSTVNPRCCYDWLGPTVAEHMRPGSGLTIHYRDVSPEFFRALGIRLEHGRLFDARDTTGAEPVVVVDEQVAERYWPGQDPLGQRVSVAEGAPLRWMTVIGVVRRIRDRGGFPGAWYVPLAQHRDSMAARRIHVFVRTAGASDALARIRDVATAASREVMPLKMNTMTALDLQYTSGERFAAILLSALAGFGLLLAAVGSYAVAAAGVQRHLPEFGIRLAMGASRAGVFMLALRSPMRLTFAGCLGGAAGAVLAGVLLRRTIFATASVEPAAVAAALAVAVLATAGACGIPAIRAARTPALQAMRRW